MPGLSLRCSLRLEIIRFYVHGTRRYRQTMLESGSLQNILEAGGPTTELPAIPTQELFEERLMISASLTVMR